MDILFPQYVHDRVLACIFVAIRCHGMKMQRYRVAYRRLWIGALAHRELIDLVIATRDTRALKVSHMESITKTKVKLKCCIAISNSSLVS